MPKRNFTLIILSVISLLMAGSTVYLLSQTSSLKADLIEIEQQSETERIELENEIEQLKEKKAASTTTYNIKTPDNNPLQEDVEAIIAETLKTTQLNDSPSESVKTGPILKVTPEVFDLGTISKAKGVVTATFELSNVGTSDLDISYAFTSCGCTVAPLKEERILKPGETFPLEVTYDPNFYGPEYELGPIEKTVTIISNSTGANFYRVKLKAMVTN